MKAKLAVLELLLSMCAMAQSTSWGSVILPENYDSTKTYPLLIDLDDRIPERYLDEAAQGLESLPADKRDAAMQQFMQAANGSPEKQLGWLLGQIFPGGSAGKEFILARISADGIPRNYSTADGFSKMILGYEAKVLAAYSTLISTRKVDTARVFLTGFSIGGDISWAIALRNPTKIRGALVMSSRASYRTLSYSSLVSGKARFVLAIGGSDDPSRIKGAKDAVALLKTQKIPSLYCETPKATHQPAPFAVFSVALGFLISQQMPTTGVCELP